MSLSLCESFRLIANEQAGPPRLLSLATHTAIIQESNVNAATMSFPWKSDTVPTK
jgi:hypothetical protein